MCETKTEANTKVERIIEAMNRLSNVIEASLVVKSVERGVEADAGSLRGGATCIDIVALGGARQINRDFIDPED